MRLLNVEIVDLTRRYDADLLKRFYHIYMTAFPIQQERESLQVWKTLLRHPQVAPPRPKFHVILAGSSLSDPKCREVYGGLTLEYYQQSACGLVAYLAVAPKYRGLGIAQRLVETAHDVLGDDARTARVSLRAVFGESHDPRQVTNEEDSMSPIERLTVMARLGAQYFDIPYVEPEVNPGHGRVRTMVLLVFHRPGQHIDSIDSQVVKDFLYEFYRAHGTVEPDKDPDVGMMMSYLSYKTIAVKALGNLVLPLPAIDASNE